MPIDPCLAEPCFLGVECFPTASPGEFSCDDCPAGYEGDGILCTDIDGCSSDPCPSETTCLDVPAPGVGFTCD